MTNLKMERNDDQSVWGYLGDTYDHLPSRPIYASTVTIVDTDYHDGFSTPVYGFVHHRTTIIIAHWDGQVILDCAGYRSKTTKDRLNRCLPTGWSVSSVSGTWKVYGPEGFCQTFEDGMTLFNVRGPRKVSIDHVLTTWPIHTVRV